MIKKKTIPKPAKKKRGPYKFHNQAEDAAVMAALLSGQGISEVSQNLGVDKSRVFRVREKIDPKILSEIEKRKLEEFPGLVADALQAILLTLKDSAEKLRTTEGWGWIKQHTPAQFATLVGVLTDKGFFLLEALEYNSGEEQRDPALNQLETSGRASDLSIQ